MKFGDLSVGDHFKMAGNDSVYKKVHCFDKDDNKIIEDEYNIEVEILGDKDRVEGGKEGPQDFTISDEAVVYPVSVEIKKTFTVKPVKVSEVEDGRKFTYASSPDKYMRIKTHSDRYIYVINLTSMILYKEELTASVYFVE